MRRTKALPRVVEIEWCDAVLSEGWARVERIPNRPTECRTVGYLAKQDRHAVTVSLSLSDTTNNVGDIMTIARPNIRRMVTLSRPKR